MLVLLPVLGVSRCALETGKSPDGGLVVLRKPLLPSVAGLLLVFAPTCPAERGCSDEPIPKPDGETPVGAVEVGIVLLVLSVPEVPKEGNWTDEPMPKTP